MTKFGFIQAPSSSKTKTITCFHTYRRIYIRVNKQRLDESRLQFYNFKFYFTLLSEIFSTFPHGTCPLLVLYIIFSLGRNSSPIFTLHYQATLLNDLHSFKQIFQDYVTGTLDGIIKSAGPFYYPGIRYECNQSHNSHLRDSGWAVFCSLAATGKILVSFYSSAY